METIETKRHAPIVNAFVYLDPSENIKYEPIVYQCKNFIIAHRGKIVPTALLVEIILQKFTEGKRTRVRKAVETYVKDLQFDKVIISLHDGYLHPLPSQTEFIKEYLRITKKTALSMLHRLNVQVKRLKLHGQYKLDLGKYDKAIYEAFTEEVEEEETATELPDIPTLTRDEVFFVDSVIKDTPTGQRGFSL